MVIGGGVGGVACALAAARNGLKVILTEEYDWIGGQLTSQAVPPDEHPWIEERGSTKTYRAFRQKVRDFYVRNYPLTDVAKKNPRLNPGNGSVSKLCHEPRVALAVMLEMLAPHITAGKVTILQPYRVMFAYTDRDTVTAAEVWSRDGSRRIAIKPPTSWMRLKQATSFPRAQTEYVTGSESRRDTKEPHAPLNADPDNHQAVTVCFAMDHEEGKDNRIEEPVGYKEWRDYTPKLDPFWPGKLFSWDMSDPRTLKPRQVGFNPTGPVAKGLNLWTYRRILDKQNFTHGFFTKDAFDSDICLVNWPQNDYWLGNLFDTPGLGKTRLRGPRTQPLLLLLAADRRTEAGRPTRVERSAVATRSDGY